MTDDDLEILKHMMNGATPPPYAVRLLEDVCERTKLSWKARHVYLQKRRMKNGADSWQAVLSIDGFRAVGSRHPQYAGQDGPYWALVPPPDHVWYDNPPDSAPYSSRVGIKKKLENGEVTTTWGVAKYRDYYAGMMWDKFPSTMIAKCAEMLAWRKTFPETFGGLYGDAEMEQTLGELRENKASMTMSGERGTVRMNPKEALHEMEIIGAVEVPEPQKEPGLREIYMVALKEAKGLDEVKKLGAEIMQKDKEGKFETQDVLQLHMQYNTMKKKYGG